MLGAEEILRALGLPLASETVLGPAPGTDAATLWEVLSPAPLDVDALARRLVHPAERLRTSRQHLQHLAARLSAAMKHQMAQLRALVEKQEAVLSGLDHLTVLARGYSLTLNLNGEVVRDDAQVKEGERIVTTLAKGRIESEVKKRS